MKRKKAQKGSAKAYLGNPSHLNLLYNSHDCRVANSKRRISQVILERGGTFTFSIALCEDNPNESKAILSLLAKFHTPGINIKSRNFDSGYKLLESVAAGEVYDLFLLDVLMPGITGVELAQRLREKDPDVPVVFLTNSTDHALAAYKVSAVQYMLKPIRETEFFVLLNKIIDIKKLQQQRLEEKFFVFATAERTLKISFSAIVYLEVTGHTIKACLENGDIFYSKSIRVPFQTAIAPLLQDRRFLYAHKSYLINMQHVQELSGRTFVMARGHVIPIPKYRIVQAKESYFQYLSECGVDYLRGEK